MARWTHACLGDCMLIHAAPACAVTDSRVAHVDILPSELEAGGEC